MRLRFGRRGVAALSGSSWRLWLVSTAIAGSSRGPVLQPEEAQGLDHSGRLLHRRALHDCRRGALPARRRDEGQGHRRYLRNRRRIPALLQGRDRPGRRVTSDARRRGGGVQDEQRRLVACVHGRQRRSHRRREPAEHLGALPHRRRAQEDLGARLEGQQLEGRPGRLPGRAAEALRRRHRLGDVRLLHRGDQRQGAREPHRLPGLRGRQRDWFRASRASVAGWGTSGTRTSWRTRTG